VYSLDTILSNYNANEMYIQRESIIDIPEDIRLNTLLNLLKSKNNKYLVII